MLHIDLTYIGATYTRARVSHASNYVMMDRLGSSPYAAQTHERVYVPRRARQRRRKQLANDAIRLASITPNQKHPPEDFSVGALFLRV